MSSQRPCHVHPWQISQYVSVSWSPGQAAGPRCNPLLCPADPYLNTDAGTMSPFEHGEVFVLDDGGEVRPAVFYDSPAKVPSCCEGALSEQPAP